MSSKQAYIYRETTSNRLCENSNENAIRSNTRISCVDIKKKKKEHVLESRNWRWTHNDFSNKVFTKDVNRIHNNSFLNKKKYYYRKLLHHVYKYFVFFRVHYNEHSTQALYVYWCIFLLGILSHVCLCFIHAVTISRYLFYLYMYVHIFSVQIVFPKNINDI